MLSGLLRCFVLFSGVLLLQSGGLFFQICFSPNLILGHRVWFAVKSFDVDVRTETMLV